MRVFPIDRMMSISIFFFITAFAEQNSDPKYWIYYVGKVGKTAKYLTNNVTESESDNQFNELEAELRQRSETELLADTLYGECTGTKDFCLPSVAWVIINRQTLKRKGNDYTNKSYSDIVLAKSQFTGLTGTRRGEGRGRNPNMRSPRWKKAYSIAELMMKYQGQISQLKARIPNRIGNRRYFFHTAYFLKNRKSCYLTPISYGNNIFFYIRDEEY